MLFCSFPADAQTIIESRIGKFCGIATYASCHPQLVPRRCRFPDSQMIYPCSSSLQVAPQTMAESTESINVRANLWKITSALWSVADRRCFWCACVSRMGIAVPAAISRRSPESRAMKNCPCVRSDAWWPVCVACLRVAAPPTTGARTRESSRFAMDCSRSGHSLAEKWACDG